MEVLGVQFGGVFHTDEGTAMDEKITHFCTDYSQHFLFAVPYFEHNCCYTWFTTRAACQLYEVVIRVLIRVEIEVMLIRVMVRL